MNALLVLCLGLIQAHQKSIDILQWYDFNPNNAPLNVGGATYDSYSYVPGFANGTFVGGALICTSGSNCFLTSNRQFTVPEEGLLQLSASLTYSSQPLAGLNATDLIADDPYYGFGSFGFVDELEGWDFGFRYTPGKVFATYGRLMGQLTDFLYMIPVANNTASACADQTIVLNKCQRSISWRISNVEVLRIQPVCSQVDERFRVLGFCREECSQGSFPCIVKVKLGNGILRPEPIECACNESRTRPACQGTLFRECFDNISNACKVNCTYDMTPRDPTSFSIGLVTQFTNLSILETSSVIGCSEEGCAQIADSPCENGCQHERDRIAFQQQSRRSPI